MIQTEDFNIFFAIQSLKLILGMSSFSMLKIGILVSTIQEKSKKRSLREFFTLLFKTCIQHTLTIQSLISNIQLRELYCLAISMISRADVGRGYTQHSNSGSVRNVDIKGCGVIVRDCETPILESELSFIMMLLVFRKTQNIII